MGDLANGLAWLCGTCCGLRNADITADGSRFSKNSKEHPAERAIDEEFMARNYRKDAAGHLHAQPTPTSSMFPRQNSDESKKSKRSAKASRESERQNQKDKGVERIDMVSMQREEDEDLPVIMVEQPSMEQHESRRRLAPVEEQASLKSAG